LKTYDIMEEWDEHEQDCLVPLYFDALDSILLEKFWDTSWAVSVEVVKPTYPSEMSTKLARTVTMTVPRADSCCLVG
jgi:hypothetical protein